MSKREEKFFFAEEVEVEDSPIGVEIKLRSVPWTQREEIMRDYQFVRMLVDGNTGVYRKVK